jgi:hypothetical protein
MTIVHSFRTGARAQSVGARLSTLLLSIKERRAAFLGIARGQYGQISDLFRYELLYGRDGILGRHIRLCPHQ